MHLRLLLTATVLLGLAAIATSQFVVRPHIENLTRARDESLQQYHNQQRAHSQAKATLTNAQAELKASEKNLLSARDQVLLANGKAVEQEQLASRLENQFNKAKQDLAIAKADLVAWSSLSIRVDQVKAIIAELKKIREANEALVAERDLLALLRREAEMVCDLTDQPLEPLLPFGLRGRILVVDPKYDFVVLDIGADKGVEPRGKLLVAREGQLVAKISIRSVQENRCVADVLPGWKLRELKEGDLVLY
jgi:hypothetical protein